MAKEKTGYVAPRRKDIKEAVCKLFPNIGPELIRRLDWWELYTIHSEIVKYGRDPETLARKFIKGHKEGEK